MDDTHRLKIRIGPHEFEAEGPADVVREQFQLFKEMVAAVSVAVPPTQQAQSEVSNVAPPSIPPADTGQTAPVNAEALAKIVKQDGRVISIVVKPKGVEDGIIMILLAQKIFRQIDWATGSEIMDGLTHTGGYSVGRVDRLMEKLSEAGDVIVTGEHRRKRYRLTNAGVSRAQKIASDLLALVA